MNDAVSKLRTDPDFLALPDEEKRKVLAAKDPDFAGLPAPEQMNVVSAIRAKAPTAAPPDVRSAIAARGGPGGTIGMPAPYGDPQERAGLTARSVAGAVGAGLGQLVGIEQIPHSAGELAKDLMNLLPTNPVQSAMSSYSTLKGLANLHSNVQQAPTGTAAAQQIVSNVPMAGPIAAQIMAPAVGYSENRPVTPAENLAGITGATSGVASLALVPRLLKGVEGLARGAPDLVQKPPTPDMAPEEIGPPGASGEAVSAAEVPLSGSPVKTGPPTMTERMPSPESTQYGKAARTDFTGVHATRVADATYTGQDIEKLVPDETQREGVFLMRDFKGQEARIPALLDGTDPAYAELTPEQRPEALARVQALRPELEAALKPTPEMLAADSKMTEYFTNTLREGTEAEVFSSSIDPASYVPHMLQPADSVPGKPSLRGSSVTRYTPNSLERFYPTSIDALIHGATPRTLDAAVATKIYGDKYGTALATRMLEGTLRESGFAKMYSDPAEVPEGWEDIAPGSTAFSRRTAIIDKDGNPQVVSHRLYAPQAIAEAMRPLTDPDFMSRMPAVRGGMIYQAYIKSMQLGLSLFHAKALNITALNNMGPTGLAKAYGLMPFKTMGPDGVVKVWGISLDSPLFRYLERLFLADGGETTVSSSPVEAYRRAEPHLDKTALEKFRDLPGVKQIDQGTAATSRVTFDILQRKFKVIDYALQRARWIAKHPNATTAELAQAGREMATEVNAAYGGLNWRALGIGKTQHTLLRLAFLAPDWTFSNWINAQTAFSKGAGGAAARMFWVRSAVTGVMMSELMSFALTRQLSPNPTMVYLGKDKEGREVHQNIFFAGAPQDAITLINNVMQYGPIAGAGRSVAGKMSPVLRTSGQLLQNTNYFGEPIVPQGAGPIGATAASVAYAGGQLAPVPFTSSNLAHMLKQPPGREPLPIEYFTTALGGVPARHVNPRSEYYVNRALRRRGVMSPAEEWRALQSAEGRQRLYQSVLSAIRGHR